ncbi:MULTISPECIES: acyl-CoA dehydrogenase family protein [Bacillus]|uniref:acyl-CoA dehydrogenase family protein n=1 Tax=Bacillus TaxID=1386 RepID=UPI000F78DC8F|nr:MULTISPECIES: acyl-CoA dehydrogenase family protein [Bacillus]MDJ0287724.1 acyl-CoA dehydrogenase family protein [Bacillus altitudinis]
MEIKYSPTFNILQKTILGAIYRSSIPKSIGGMETINSVSDFKEAKPDYQQIWDNLKELGVPGFSIPLNKEGYELGETTVIMIVKELGKILFDKPYLDTLIASDILSLANDSLSENSLSSIMNGESFIGVLGLSSEIYCNNISNQHKNLSVSSYNQYLSNVEQINQFLLVVNNNVYRLPKNASGIEIKEVKNISNTRISKVSLNNVQLFYENLVSIDEINFKQILGRARLRQAAYLIGLSEGALVEGINYTNRRKQFDKKLIENQSISSVFASLLAQLEGAQLKLEHTAWLDEQNKNIFEEGTKILALVAEIALDISRKSLHFHGAFGMTKLSKIEEYYRFIALEAVRYGTPKDLWLEVGKFKMSSLKENFIHQ